MKLQMSNYFFLIRISFVDIFLRNTHHYTARRNLWRKANHFFLSLVIVALDDVPIERETHVSAAFECYVPVA